jgi:hypothetical protein
MNRNAIKCKFRLQRESSLVTQVNRNI